jgi:hypothetical protein
MSPRYRGACGACVDGSHAAATSSLPFDVLLRPGLEAVSQRRCASAGLQRDLQPLGGRRRGLRPPRSISESVITHRPDHDVEDAAERIAARGGQII